MNPIGPVGSSIQIGSVAGISIPGQVKSSGASVFQAAMVEAVQNVDQAQKTAQSSMQSFLNGEGGELHTVALDQQKAALTFDMFLQVRNKVVQAYQEVMRMPV